MTNALRDWAQGAKSTAQPCHVEVGIGIVEQLLAQPRVGVAIPSHGGEHFGAVLALPRRNQRRVSPLGQAVGIDTRLLAPENQARPDLRLIRPNCECFGDGVSSR